MNTGIGRKRLALLVLLAATACLLRVRGNSDQIVSSLPLTLIAMHVGDWWGMDVPLTADVLKTLGDGRFLNRTYRPGVAMPQEVPVDLLIAYFPSQRSGQSIHSPQNCLPGAGWTFTKSGRLTFLDESGRPHRVGEYVLTSGNATLEVLYWYRSRGIDIANDYVAKGYLMVQAIRDRRTDGALIRISTTIQQGESQAAARQRVVHFAASLDPLLPPFLPE